MKFANPAGHSAGMSLMSAKFFLDTNIIIYTFDKTAAEKQNKAKSLVRSALAGSGCISWQVIQEFCNAALGKFIKPMGREELRDYFTAVLFPLCTVWADKTVYREALTVGLETGYSWYDSLIVAAAVEAGARILYSEDLQHNRKYRSLTIKNPFME